MKDRISTQVLANGAIRYAEYDAQGNFVAYHYMLAADEPSEIGTPLNKATFLKDATAALLSLGSNPVVDDALNGLISLANSKARLEVVEYVGTGTNTVSVSFSSVPQFVFVTRGFMELSTLATYDYLFPNADRESISKLRTYSINESGSTELYIDYKWTSDRKTLTWSHYGSTQSADNYSGIHYRAIAVC